MKKACHLKTRETFKRTDAALHLNTKQNNNSTHSNPTMKTPILEIQRSLCPPWILLTFLLGHKKVCVCIHIICVYTCVYCAYMYTHMCLCGCVGVFVCVCMFASVCVLYVPVCGCACVCCGGKCSEESIAVRRKRSIYFSRFHLVVDKCINS